MTIGVGGVFDAGFLEGVERAFEPGNMRLTRTFTPSVTDDRPAECGLYLTCKGSYSTLVNKPELLLANLPAIWTVPG